MTTNKPKLLAPLLRCPNGPVDARDFNPDAKPGYPNGKDKDGDDLRTELEPLLDDLQERTGLRELWVGEEFALGKDRAGTIDRLREIGAQLGFRVVAVPRLTNGTEVVSSSRVRQAVASGDVVLARRLLGRPFRVEGEVVHGQKLGRTIGFPTANVAGSAFARSSTETVPGLKTASRTSATDWIARGRPSAATVRSTTRRSPITRGSAWA